jgi:tetratricopeptide (TPR) repeat protein
LEGVVATESRGTNKRHAPDHTDMVSLHPLVIETTSWLTARDQRQNRYTWMTASSVAVNAQREAGNPTDPHCWDRWQLLAPHFASAARSLTAHALRHRNRSERHILTAAKAASKYQSSSGQFRAAADTLAICRDLTIRIYGPGSRRTRKIRHDVAHALWNAGQRTEADSEFIHGLNSGERLARAAMGSAFPGFHAKLHELDRPVSNEPVSNENELDETVVNDVMARVLRLQLALLRRNSPRTFTTRFKLAGILAAQGNLAGAEAEYRTILDGETRVLGAENPDTLTTRRRLASVWAEQGNLEQAKAEYRAVLDAQT